MLERLDQLYQSAKADIASAKDESALQAVETSLLGRKGSLLLILKSLRDVPADIRGEVGKKANEIKQELLETLDQRRSSFSPNAAGTGAASFDLTLPGKKQRKGGLHPITKTIYELNDAFLSLGFEVYEGPEISSEAFAFDALNFSTRSSC